MRRIIVCFLLIVCLFSYLISPSFATTSEYNRAYQDYLYTFNQYRSAHQNYLTAKNKYSTYKTLSAKTEALNATAKMLELRDETLKTYLLAVRLKLAETAETTLSLSYFANMLYINLEKETNWLADHQTKFSAAATFSDLLAFSSETENRQPRIELLAYQALASSIGGQLKAASDETGANLQTLKEKVGLIREEGKMEIIIPERWLLEAENKYQLSLEKQNKAAQVISNLSAGEGNEGFQNATNFYQEANQYLKETTSYLLETIAYLRGEK